MSENGSKETDTSSSVTTETMDMDSTEKINQEKLDLNVSSSLNSKEISSFTVLSSLIFKYSVQHFTSLSITLILK
jgi:hypothetical protein